MGERRAAYFNITLSTLGELLQLPEGAKIVRIEMRSEHDRAVRLYLTGIGKPVSEGDLLDCIYPAVVTRADEYGRLPPEPRITWPIA
jgi:hypothetical protein